MERRNERASVRRDKDTARDARYAFASRGSAAPKLGPAGGEPPPAPVANPVDRPISVLLFLLMWPFWLFRDASRGDRFARAAAYRHNRAMRVHLPGYLFRWSVGAVLVFALMAAAESMAGVGAPAPLFILLAVALGVVFAASVCVVFVTGYLYWYLSRNEEG